MRVAVLPYAASGGLSTYALELSEALAERGLDVTLFGGRKGAASAAVQYKPLPHLDTLKRIKDPLLWNATIGADASDILRGSSIDVVHCVYPALVPFISCLGAVVCSGWYNPHNLQTRLSRAIKMPSFSLSRLPELYGHVEYFVLDEFGYRQSKSIFAITRNLKENLVRRFGEKVRYLPPGIKPPSSTRKVGGEKTRITCIAADLENPRKGVSILLKALESIQPSLLEKAEISLIGGYSSRLEVQVQMLQRRKSLLIKLLSYAPREKIFENLLQTDILVCPSLYEEFGYVILEAMSAGVPVVATRIRPLTDIIVNGVCGFLYQRENINELSSLISMLIMDSEMRHTMGEEARRRVMEEFSWNSIAQRLENYYREILNGDPD